MGRWEPNARGRLEQAALELYQVHGFDQTTAAEIARRAGLSERTFFRYFADKREVLFAGATALEEHLVGAIEAAPAGDTPIDALRRCLQGVAELLEGRRDYARRRNAVIAANAELRERELIKLASLVEALADALRRRGVAEPGASLTAEAGIAVFKVAFGRWVAAAEGGTLSGYVDESLDELRSLTVGS
jgi:AcrR family transcriptional regulator